MNIYRKIWTEHHGPIPKDINNKTYEIHHIDGDHANNDITNLQCISVQEHYDIHWNQQDYGVCWKMSNRMDLSSEELSTILKLSNQQRLKNGTHHFLDKNAARKRANKRIALGTHPFLDKNKAKERALKMVENGTLNLLGGNIIKQALVNGTFHSQKKHTCPICGKIGYGNGMKRWHFTNCRYNSI